MENLANEYVTTLAEAIDDDDTEFDLTDAPPASLAAGNFRLRLGAADETDPEYVLVGTVSGSTVSGCTRGVEGSTPASWGSGTVAAQVMTRAGLYDLAPRSNFEAVAPPDVDADETEGYAVGSRWIDTDTGTEYVCVDPDTGAAVWIELAPAGSSGASWPGDTKPTSPGANDEEWEGTADTLPTDWAWVSAAPTFNINSYYPSLFVIERADTTERKVRKSNFTMAATSGLWIKFGVGGKWGASSQFEFIIYDSASSDGYGFGIHNQNVALARDSNAGSLSNRGTFSLEGNQWMAPVYMGVMRVSNTWQTFVSRDGISWSEVQSADTRSFTVARLELRWSMDNAVKTRGWIDWIRYRTDNEFPRP